MIVYKVTDRIPVKIGEITFWVSPLTFSQRNELASYAQMKGGVENIDNMKVVMSVLKFSLKQVDGLTCADGSPYVLELGQDGCATDDAIGEIMGISGADKLITAASMLAGQIKEHDIKGVKIDLTQVRSVKKTQ